METNWRNMSLFSEFDNVRTLYVIGNGFDLHHGMKTSYADFHKFAMREDSEWVCLMEQYFPETKTVNLKERYKEKDRKESRNLLWSDLEKALGIFDIPSTYNDMIEYVDDREGHEFTNWYQRSDLPGETLKKMYDRFCEIYNGWINNIQIGKIKDTNICHFNKEGMFLTFNYTETLETLYNVSQININYIHGRRGNSCKLIIGHNKPEVKYEKLIITPSDPLRKNAYKDMSRFYNNLRKDVDGIIR